MKAAFSIPSTWRTPQPLRVDQTFDTGTDKNWNLVLLTNIPSSISHTVRGRFSCCLSTSTPVPHSLNLLLLFGPSSAVAAFTATSSFLFALDFFFLMSELLVKVQKRLVLKGGVWFRVWFEVVCNAVMLARCTHGSSPTSSSILHPSAVCIHTNRSRKFLSAALFFSFLFFFFFFFNDPAKMILARAPPPPPELLGSSTHHHAAFLWSGGQYGKPITA